MSVRPRTWTSPTGEPKSAWEVSYRAANGKRVRKLFDLKRDADAFHAKARQAVQNGTHTPDSQSVTVNDAAARWLARCDERGLERATCVAYGQHIGLHIGPYIGGLKLSQLTAPMVAELEDKLRAEGRSPVMVRKTITTLGAILKFAQRRGLVAQNVVKAMGRDDAPTARAEGEGRAEVGVNCPTPAEVRALLPQLQGTLRPLLLTAIFTGLRWSELRGLAWAAIDLKAGTLTVSQRMDRHGQIGAPKSAAGNRTVPLLALVVNALRELRLASTSGDLVFVNGQGHALHRNTVIEAYQQAQVAAWGSVKYPGLHALRHFFASWCINRKADGGRELPLKVVQGLLGHASIQMTADVYGHLFPRGDDTAELQAAERAFLAG